MAITLNSLKCPECGASLPVEEGCRHIFCAFCGASIAITNDHEFIFRNIDEAGIKQAETDRVVGLSQSETERMVGLRQAETEREIMFRRDETKRMVELKKLELEEKKMAEIKNAKALKGRIIVILGLIAVIAFVIACNSGNGNSPGYIVGSVSVIILLLVCLEWHPEEKVYVERKQEREIKVRVPNGLYEYEKKNYSAIEKLFRSAGFKNITCVPLEDLTLGWFKKPGTVESITVNGRGVTAGEEFSQHASVVITYHSKSI